MRSSPRRGGMGKNKVAVQVRFEIESGGWRLKSHHVRPLDQDPTRLRSSDNLSAMDHSHHDHGMHTGDVAEARCKMWMLWYVRRFVVYCSRNQLLSGILR